MSDVRLATPDDAPSIVETLLSAFEHDPFVAWVVKQRGARARRLYFETALRRLTLPHGLVWVDDAGTSTALWAPSTAWRLGAVEQLALVPRIARIVGWSRLGEVSRAIDTVERGRPHSPYHLLVLLGTRPEARGRGSARRLVEVGLRACAERGADAVLDTSNEANLGFYQQLGFRITRRVDLPDGPPCWSMRWWRSPAEAV